MMAVPASAFALISAIFVFDVLTPVDIAVWLFYLIPIILSTWWPSRAKPFVVALICTVLTVVGFFLAPTDSPVPYAVINRSMGIAVFWIVAVLLARSNQAQKLRELTRQLETANKELESFSYSVSHDLQAPLRAIKGFSQMVLKDTDHGTDAETRRKLGIIQESADKMQRLIEGLLSLSRVGRQGLRLGTIDMNALVKDVWKELETNCPGVPMVLKAGDLAPARGDHTLVRQILANLLSNAVKYSRYRKLIEVEVDGYREKGENVYFVKDRGAGFDMKYYDKLFGVFQRLHSASEFEGTGIGLSIAQRIVHMHGGKIWAEGEVDKGATFFFALPTRQE